MSTFIVPQDDGPAWPSLGGAICDFIETFCVFGPGSLKGEPAVLDDEKRAAIWKAYEVYPKGHALAGRRRFRRVRFSWRKGSAKTEFGAWISFAELHPEGPVRFDGWDANGEPVGRPVRDPYIPLLAYTKDQVAELAYGALMVVCQEGPEADMFDVSKERIIRLDERGRADGKAVPLAGSPSARDGARTTFQYYDETHRLAMPSQVEAYETMEANLPKRPLDDPWSLGTTTAGVPGGGSVAEKDKDEAESIDRGEIDEPELFYFHREAGTHSPTTKVPYDLTRMDDRIEAVREASGPAVSAWSDLRGVARQWDRPGADHAYLERVWLNRWTAADRQAFDVIRWQENTRTGQGIPDGAAVALGLDGSRWKDTTALVATDLRTGLQVEVATWKPLDEGEVPPSEVLAKVVESFDRWNVSRLYIDPAWGWDDMFSELAGKYGQKRVMAFYTDSRGQRRTALMCRTYADAIRAGEVLNDGSATMLEHISNARRREVKLVDDEGQPLWLIVKERHDSPKKIDAAMAGALSWQARLDAIATGALATTDEYVYFR